MAKVPFDLDTCITTSYDITSYQPQLFVCESFEQLTEAVHVLAERLGLPLGHLESAEAGVPIPPRVSSRSSQDTPEKAYPAEQIALYQGLRDLRQPGVTATERESRLSALRAELDRYPQDWLARLEWLELASQHGLMPQAQADVREALARLSSDADQRELIANGLALLEPAPAGTRA